MIAQMHNNTPLMIIKTDVDMCEIANNIFITNITGPNIPETTFITVVERGAPLIAMLIVGTSVIAATQALPMEYNRLPPQEA
ncbi:hypothetical protein LJB94_02120 [Odoribacter sp. OttesenSCG-928-G04]|nr:hypothetical protein [Odoribacter sp. OttesenSCG-928-G04]